MYNFLSDIINENEEEGKTGSQQENQLKKLLGGNEECKAQTDIKTRFSDVKGIDEFKEELEEIVSFLKNPEKYQKIGASLPKGVLMCGLPGTGKTLLAKAVAGEAGVPFYSKSGSEFDEIFIGMGARRIRSLFQQAKDNSPCIIFIDEIDALASKRTEFSNGSKDTLNELLVQMDGFDTNNQVIVLAATNMVDMLDPAIKRPGRFDKIIDIPLPSVKGREEIIKLYLDNVKHEKNVSPKKLSKQTTGLSGAEIKNMINTAVLQAIRENRTQAKQQDFEDAMDIITMGIARNVKVSESDKLETAYHEGGHALCALLTPGSMPLNKVTILSRGSALGYTSYIPSDEYKQSRKTMIAQIDCLLAGRVGEEILLGKDDVTTGCHDDLQKATRLAYAYVRQAAFSDKINWISGNQAITSNISEKFKYIIDKEVQKILKTSYGRVSNLLRKNKPLLDKLAKELVEHEVLSSKEIEVLLNIQQKV